MKELTVGNRHEGEKKIPEGYAQVRCQFCYHPMICQEKNSKPKNPGDELVLCCIKCVDKL
jgi:hypothetical protein